MITHISNFFHAIAKPKNILLAFLINMFFGMFVMPYCKNIIDPNNLIQVLDLKVTGYTSEDVYSIFDVIGEQGRKYYLLVESIIDLVYPLTYMILYGLLLSFLLSLVTSSKSNLWKLNVLPLLAGTFDYLENINIINLLLKYPKQLPTLVWISSTCSILKWLTILMCLIVAIICLFVWLGRKLFLK